MTRHQTHIRVLIRRDRIIYEPKFKKEDYYAAWFYSGWVSTHKTVPILNWVEDGDRLDFAWSK